MAQSGSDWLRISQHGLEWLRMALNGSKWSRMVKNGPDWFRLAQNVTELPNLSSKHVKAQPKIEKAIFEDDNLQLTNCKNVNLQPFKVTSFNGESPVRRVQNLSILS